MNYYRLSRSILHAVTLAYILLIAAPPAQAQWDSAPLSTVLGTIDTGQIQSPGGHSRAEFVTWDCADSQCQDRSFYADMDTFVPRGLIPMHAWYIRAIPDGFNDAFPLPQSAVLFGDTATAHWTGGGVDGVLSATLNIRVEDPNGVPDEGQARLVQHMTISNSGTQDHVINLFAYADVDANGDANGDAAEDASGADGVLVVVNDNVGSIPVSEIQMRAPGADRFQVAPFDMASGLPETVLLGSNADLDNSGLPFGPGDITAAVQWSDTVIPAGDSVTFRLIIAENSAPIDEYDGISIDVAPTALNLGAVAVGDNASDSATITNTGTVALEVSALAGPSAPFAVTGGSCPQPPFELSPQVACTLEVSFAPDQAGNFQSSITVLSDADPAVVSLTGQALVSGPGIMLEPDYLELLGVQVGSSASGEVSVQSIGTAALNVQAMELPSSPFSLGSLGTCPDIPFSLQPDAACTLELVFTPTEIGSFHGTLEMTSDAGPANLQLYGESWMPGPDLSAYPGWLEFGMVEAGKEATVTVTLESTGTEPLAVHALDGPDAPFELDGGSCGSLPFNLEPGMFCSLDIRFAPQTAGVATSSITIRSNAVSGDREIPMSGEGIPKPQPVLALDTGTVDFGTVEIGDSAVPETVTLSSIGNVPVTVTGISEPNAPFMATSGDCPVTPFELEPEESCTLAYGFMPAGEGTFDATVEITAAEVGVTEVVLQGEGVITPPLENPVFSDRFQDGE